MAEATSEKTIRIAPSRWRWGALVAVSLFGWIFLITQEDVDSGIVFDLVQSPSGMGLWLIYCGLQMAGITSWLELTPTGFRYRELWKTGSFQWRDVSEFNLQSGYGFIVRNERVAFTPIAKQKSMGARFARLFGTGTDSVPALGRGRTLVNTMNSLRHGQIETLPRFQRAGEVTGPRQHPSSNSPAAVPKPAFGRRSLPSNAIKAPAPIGKRPAKPTRAQPGGQGRVVTEGGWSFFRKDRSKLAQ